MASAMNVTVGPWVRESPEQTAADTMAEAHALRAALLAATRALCEEWLAEADEEAQAILARADAQAAAILEAARSWQNDAPERVVLPLEARLLGLVRRLFRRS